MKKILTTIFFAIVLITIVYAQDGNNDNTFNIGTGANSFIQTTSIQSNGKIMIGGVFTTYNGTSINRIARLNTDGTIDTSFNPGTGANGTINKLTIQSDGKIIITGQFTSYNGTSRNRIARLNTDGTLDSSFDPGTGGNNQIIANSIQSDGKIIIVGQFTSYNGTSRNRIARLNTDGTLDTTFNPGTGANDYIATNSLQSDGKIIIGGHFISYNGIGINKIARLNSDGTLDSLFNPGSGFDSYVYSSSIQNDGKIILGGTFTLFNGILINRIARLNSDGTIDNAFNSGTGAGHSVESMAIQNDGKIIIVGFFNSYNGTAINRIARLNTDGTLDTSFNPGTGTTNGVVSISIQNDGKIIIGGDFTSYNGVARNNIARIMAGGCIVSQQPALACYETATFNNTTCQWDVTGTQPTQPTLACYETATFNNTTCQWDVTGTPPSITVQPFNQTVLLNANAQLIVISSETNATYQWQSEIGIGFQNLNSIGQYSGTTKDTLTISNVTMSNDNQQFRCIVFSGSCSDTSNIAVLTVNNNVSIIETSQDNLFSVFPNPAQSVINVKADIKLIGEVYTINDNTGRVVLTGKINSQHTTIELGNLSVGVYMFSVGEKLKQTFKLIKE